MEAMEVVDEYGALRQLLHGRCPGSTFRESDIRSLWDAGFESEADLKAADRECLTSILPKRQGKVAVLLRTFAQSEATTGLKDDKSRSWSEVMLLKELPELPQDEVGLRDILFPNENGRLPVTDEIYSYFRGTSLEVIQLAYNVANECKFLARASQEPKLTANTYSVRIAPLGCEVKLDSEQDGKKFALNVCTALAALHRNGIVHRDVRLPNIVKVFEPQTEEYYFMVIDLETVAKADFELPKGFDHFRFWTRRTLEGKRYTPRSDMYHLGMVMSRAMKDSANLLAKSFIGDLISKQLDAEMALSHIWLSDEVL